MPISMKTEGLRKHKDDLENRLKTVERGIAMFSK